MTVLFECGGDGVLVRNEGRWGWWKKKLMVSWGGEWIDDKVMLWVWLLLFDLLLLCCKWWLIWKFFLGWLKKRERREIREKKRKEWGYSERKEEERKKGELKKIMQVSLVHRVIQYASLNFLFKFSSPSHWSIMEREYWAAWRLVRGLSFFSLWSACNPLCRWIPSQFPKQNRYKRIS